VLIRSVQRGRASHTDRNPNARSDVSKTKVLISVCLSSWCVAMLAWALAARSCQKSGGVFVVSSWTCRTPPPSPILERGIKRVQLETSR
jgi:hypothetical protein